MASYSGHQGLIKMDVTAGATAVTDISGGITGFDFTVNRNIGQHHTLGGNWQRATVGGITTTFSITAEVDATTNSAYSVLTAAATEAVGTASRTFELYVPSAATGSIKWSGEGFVQGGANVSAKAGDGAPQVATFAVITDSTWTMAVVA